MALTLLSGATAVAQHNSTAKTTATAQRVVGVAGYGYTTGGYQLSDSSAFSWSGARSSVLITEPGIPLKKISIDAFDATQSWSGATKDLNNRTLRTYDADGNNVIEYSYHWNTATSSWDSVGSVTTGYIGGKKQESLIKKHDVVTGMLENNVRETYTYSGADMETLTERWNMGTGNWEKYQLTVGTYSGTKLVALVTKQWVSGAWDTESRQTMTYTGAVLSRSVTEYQESGSWYNGSKDETFFAAGKIVADSQSNWNRATNKWEPVAYNVYSYSGAEMTEKIAAGWVPVLGEWELQKNLYTYSGGNVVEDISQFAGPVAGTWSNAYHELYEYDANNNRVTDTREKWNGSAWIPHESGFRKHYYYEDYSTTGIPAMVPWVSKASVYPNPAMAPHIYVDYFTERADATEVVLSNTLGQVIYRTAEAGSIGDHSVTVPVSALAPGVYFVSIYSGHQHCRTMKLLR